MCQRSNPWYGGHSCSRVGLSQWYASSDPLAGRVERVSPGPAPCVHGYILMTVEMSRQVRK